MSATAGRVLRLWRYPVKSMAGEACARLGIDAHGVSGDRAYAIRAADGRLGSGKSTRLFRQIDGLLGFGARVGDAGPEIRFPDGRALGASDAGMDAALSETLGQAVSLESGGTNHVDAGAVHLVTTASLAWLQARLPAARLDERRFRPNVVLDCAGTEPLEQAWVGRVLAFAGGVRLRVAMPTERCRMVTLLQDDLPHDARVLHVLAEAAELMFGVYADVEVPGTVALDEAVDIV